MAVWKRGGLQVGGSGGGRVRLLLAVRGGKSFDGAHSLIGSGFWGLAVLAVRRFLSFWKAAELCKAPRQDTNNHHHYHAMPEPLPASSPLPLSSIISFSFSDLLRSHLRLSDPKQ